MAKGDVPYARFECTWFGHSIRRKYTITQRYIYDTLYIYCVHEKRDLLPADCYPLAHLAHICGVDTRTMQCACDKLVSDGDLLKRMSDGSLFVVGVRVKNKKISWKNDDPFPHMGDVRPPQKGKR